MYKSRYLFGWLVFAAILVACSGGGQDPVSAEGVIESMDGRLSKGASGPNITVSLDNLGHVAQDLNEVFFSTFIKQMSALESSPTDTVRINGNYSGYAIIDNSPTLNQTEKSLGYNVKLTFFDYSDGGQIFMGGAFLLAGSIPGEIFVAGNIQFAGTYGGSASYTNFMIPTDETGNMISIFAPCEIMDSIERSGSVTFKSGGNTIVRNPYPIVVDIIVIMRPSGKEEITYICDPDYGLDYSSQ
jgi:hypothetical protein